MLGLAKVKNYNCLAALYLRCIRMRNRSGASEQSFVMALCFFHSVHVDKYEYTRVGTLILATIYLQLIQNRYMFQSFTVLHCSHQHCVQPIASDVEVVGYL